MRVVVVTPPDAVVSLAEAKDHLGVRHVDQDALIIGMVAAATAHIDGPDGWLGRAIGVQTLEARFALAWCREVRLPFPPVVDLVSVKYLDAGNVEQTADNADFALYGPDLTPLGTWPWEGGSARPEAARVQYRAGYETLPPAIRAAIMLMVGDLYAFRESAVAGVVGSVPISVPVAALLAPFRVYA